MDQSHLRLKERKKKKKNRGGRRAIAAAAGAGSGSDSAAGDSDGDDEFVYFDNGYSLDLGMIRDLQVMHDLTLTFGRTFSDKKTTGCWREEAGGGSALPHDAVHRQERVPAQAVHQPEHAVCHESGRLVVLIFIPRQQFLLTRKNKTGSARHAGQVPASHPPAPDHAHQPGTGHAGHLEARHAGVQRSSRECRRAHGAQLPLGQGVQNLKCFNLI